LGLEGICGGFGFWGCGHWISCQGLLIDAFFVSESVWQLEDDGTGNFTKPIFVINAGGLLVCNQPPKLSSEPQM
jgi:hypothetical protein